MSEQKRQTAAKAQGGPPMTDTATNDCVTCTYNPRKATISQAATLAGTLLTILVMGGGVILATGRLSERIDNNCRTMISMQRDVEIAKAKTDSKMDMELYQLLQGEVSKRLDRIEGKVDQLLQDNQRTNGAGR